MNGPRRGRGLPWAVLIVSAILLVVSIVVSALSVGGPWVGSSPGFRGMGGPMMGGPMMGGPMMGGFGDVAAGPVDDIVQARSLAEQVANARGLRVREVMQFDNGYYVQLERPDGAPATELLIDPSTGVVRIEWGPAMMWNIDYGMGSGAGPGDVSSEKAVSLADAWLAENRPGETASDPTAFPGYFTLHTVKDGKITGMLSVNTSTGAIWYHSWHGAFVRGEGEKHKD